MSQEKNIQFSLHSAQMMSQQMVGFKLFIQIIYNFLQYLTPKNYTIIIKANLILQSISQFFVFQQLSTEGQMNISVNFLPLNTKKWQGQIRQDLRIQKKLIKNILEHKQCSGQTKIQLMKSLKQYLKVKLSKIVHQKHQLDHFKEAKQFYADKFQTDKQHLIISREQLKQVDRVQKTIYKKLPVLFDKFISLMNQKKISMKNKSLNQCKGKLFQSLIIPNVKMTSSVSIIPPKNYQLTRNQKQDSKTKTFIKTKSSIKKSFFSKQSITQQSHIANDIEPLTSEVRMMYNKIQQIIKTFKFGYKRQTELNMWMKQIKMFTLNDQIARIGQLLIFPIQTTIESSQSQQNKYKKITKDFQHQYSKRNQLYINMVNQSFSLDKQSQKQSIQNKTIYIQKSQNSVKPQNSIQRQLSSNQKIDIQTKQKCIFKYGFESQKDYSRKDQVLQNSTKKVYNSVKQMNQQSIQQNFFDTFQNNSNNLKENFIMINQKPKSFEIQVQKPQTINKSTKFHSRYQQNYPKTYKNTTQNIINGVIPELQDQDGKKQKQKQKQNQKQSEINQNSRQEGSFQWKFYIRPDQQNMAQEQQLDMCKQKTNNCHQQMHTKQINNKTDIYQQKTNVLSNQIIQKQVISNSLMENQTNLRQRNDGVNIFQNNVFQNSKYISLQQNKQNVQCNVEALKQQSMNTMNSYREQSSKKMFFQAKAQSNNSSIKTLNIFSSKKQNRVDQLVINLQSNTVSFPKNQQINNPFTQKKPALDIFKSKQTNGKSNIFKQQKTNQNQPVNSLFGIPFKSASIKQTKNVFMTSFSPLSQQSSKLTSLDRNSNIFKSSAQIGGNLFKQNCVFGQSKKIQICSQNKSSQFF